MQTFRVIIENIRLVLICKNILICHFETRCQRCFPIP